MNLFLARRLCLSSPVTRVGNGPEQPSDRLLRFHIDWSALANWVHPSRLIYTKDIAFSGGTFSECAAAACVLFDVTHLIWMIAERGKGEIIASGDLELDPGGLWACGPICSPFYPLGYGIWVVGLYFTPTTPPLLLQPPPFTSPAYVLWPFSKDQVIHHHHAPRMTEISRPHGT